MPSHYRKVKRKGRRGTVGHAAAKRAKAPKRKKATNRRTTNRQVRSNADQLQIRERQRQERAVGIRRGRG